MPYDPEFIPGHSVPLPVPGERVTALSFTGDYIHHSRHSLLFNEERGFAFVSAHNIDGASLASPQHTGRSFKNDPKIQPTSLQVDKDRGYRTSAVNGLGPNPWDQGHLARRKSLSWGDVQHASIAERESDMWSNIAPQHENLHDDAWAEIEDWMLDRVADDGHRACVFTGPVFTEDDPEHKNGPNEDPIRIPAGFWKVMSVAMAGQMRSAGFLVWQRDYDSDEPLGFSPVLEQVRLTTIEVLTGLTFPSLRQFDPLLFDLQSSTRARAVAQARDNLRRQITPQQSGTPVSNNQQGDDMITQATPQRTGAIHSKHDIVL